MKQAISSKNLEEENLSSNRERELEDKILKRVVDAIRKERITKELADMKSLMQAKKRSVQAVTWKTGNKKVTQYTITIPKEYAELAEINPKEFEAIFQCKNIGTNDTPEYRITAEIKKIK